MSRFAIHVYSCTTGAVFALSQTNVETPFTFTYEHVFLVFVKDAQPVTNTATARTKTIFILNS
jgi:hypothetical protein